MRRALVAGNWKMNGTRASVDVLLGKLLEQSEVECDVVVFPSSIHLQQVLQGVQKSFIEVGAQNCAVKAGFGALTGEVSVEQLLDLGCKWVLVGHSERRELLQEGDKCVAEKFALALQVGLTPILCVGESLEEHNAGQADVVVCKQIDAVLERVGIAAFEQAVIAYEPVWAIGTGLTATPEQAQGVHEKIRAHLASQDVKVADRIRILYGGSVKADNAAELFAMPDIDGGLVGGASLVGDEFGAICRAARG